MIAERNVVPEPFGWIHGNHAVLSAELRRIAALLALKGGEPGAEAALVEADAEIVEARGAVPGPAAVDWVADSFALSEFERAVLLLCAGVEMDSSIAKQCATVTGGPWATFGIALAAFPGAHWTALLPEAPLRRWVLVESGIDTSIVASPLRISETVLHALAGLEVLDPELEPIVTHVVPGPLAAADHLALVEIVAGRPSSRARDAIPAHWRRRRRPGGRRCPRRGAVGSNPVDPLGARHSSRSARSRAPGRAPPTGRRSAASELPRAAD